MLISKPNTTLRISPHKSYQNRRWSPNTRATTDSTDHIVVVGGGVGGLATAVALSQCDIPVTVLEKNEGLRQEGTALGLLSNAWRALEAIGIADDLRSINPLNTKVDFYTADGEKLNSFGLKGTEMRGVIRRKLIAKLAEQLPEDCIQFKSDVVDLDLSNPKLPVLKLSNGRSIKCRMVVGADGNKSVIGSALGQKMPKYCGNTAIRGVSEFETLPIPSQSIVYYLGQGIRSGMYQIEDNKVYWFISNNAPEDTRMENEEAVLNYAKELAGKFNPTVNSCVDNVMPESLSFAKLGDRIASPIEAPGRGLVTLVGDAFHPMTPNLGQGGALALEDAIVLGRKVAYAGGLAGDESELVGALREYELERLRRVVPMTIRSRVVGNLLSIPYEPVVAARNALISKVDLGTILVSTAKYDCGRLPVQAAQNQ